MGVASERKQSLEVNLLLLGSQPVPCLVSSVNQSGIELSLGSGHGLNAEQLRHGCRPGAAAAVLVARPGEESWQVPAVFFQKNQQAISLRYAGAPPPEANRLARLFSEIRAGH